MVGWKEGHCGKQGAVPDNDSNAVIRIKNKIKKRKQTVSTFSVLINPLFVCTPVTLLLPRIVSVSIPESQTNLAIELN